MVLDAANYGVHVSTPQSEQSDNQPEVSIKVDKIQVAIYFEHSIDEFLQFPAYKYDVLHGHFGKKGAVHKAHPSSGFTAMSQPLENGGCLFIRYGYSHKMYKAFLEFNPNKVDMFELRGHLDLLLHHGYESLLNRGIVTECEFAVDVMHARFLDYLYLEPKLRSGSSQLRVVGSDYVGSKRSSRSFLAYDKRKELLDHKGGALGYDLLRIEARIRGAKRFPLAEIAAFGSPFDTFFVIDRNAFMVSALPAVSKLRDQLQYSDGCLQLAYSGLSPMHRQQALAALSGMSPNWWQPDAIWSAFPHSQFVTAQSKTWLH